MVNDTEAGLWVSIFLQQQPLGHYTVSSGHGQISCFFNTGVVICVSTGSCQSVLMQAQHVPAVHLNAMDQRQL